MRSFYTDSFCVKLINTFKNQGFLILNLNWRCNQEGFHAKTLIDPVHGGEQYCTFLVPRRNNVNWSPIMRMENNRSMWLKVAYWFTMGKSEQKSLWGTVCSVITDSTKLRNLSLLMKVNSSKRLQIADFNKVSVFPLIPSRILSWKDKCFNEVQVLERCKEDDKATDESAF